MERIARAVVRRIFGDFFDGAEGVVFSAFSGVLTIARICVKETLVPLPPPVTLRRLQMSDIVLSFRLGSPALAIGSIDADLHVVDGFAMTPSTAVQEAGAGAHAAWGAGHRASVLGVEVLSSLLSRIAGVVELAVSSLTVLLSVGSTSPDRIRLKLDRIVASNTVSEDLDSESVIKFDSARVDMVPRGTTEARTFLEIAHLRATLSAGASSAKPAEVDPPCITAKFCVVDVIICCAPALLDAVSGWIDSFRAGGTREYAGAAPISTSAPEAVPVGKTSLVASGFWDVFDQYLQSGISRVLGVPSDSDAGGNAGFVADSAAPSLPDFMLTSSLPVRVTTCNFSGDFKKLQVSLLLPRQQLSQVQLNVQPSFSAVEDQQRFVATFYSIAWDVSERRGSSSSLLAHADDSSVKVIFDHMTIVAWLRHSIGSMPRHVDPHFERSLPLELVPTVVLSASEFSGTVVNGHLQQRADVKRDDSDQTVAVAVRTRELNISVCNSVLEAGLIAAKYLSTAMHGMQVVSNCEVATDTGEPSKLQFCATVAINACRVECYSSDVVSSAAARAGSGTKAVVTLDTTCVHIVRGAHDGAWTKHQLELIHLQFDLAPVSRICLHFARTDSNCVRGYVSVGNAKLLLVSGDSHHDASGKDVVSLASEKHSTGADSLHDFPGDGHLGLDVVGIFASLGLLHFCLPNVNDALIVQNIVVMLACFQTKALAVWHSPGSADGASLPLPSPTIVASVGFQAASLSAIIKASPHDFNAFAELRQLKVTVRPPPSTTAKTELLAGFSLLSALCSICRADSSSSGGTAITDSVHFEVRPRVVTQPGVEATWCWPCDTPPFGAESIVTGGSHIRVNFNSSIVTRASLPAVTQFAIASQMAASALVAAFLGPTSESAHMAQTCHSVPALSQFSISDFRFALSSAEMLLFMGTYVFAESDIGPVIDVKVDGVDVRGSVLNDLHLHPQSEIRCLPPTLAYVACRRSFASFSFAFPARTNAGSSVTLGDLRAVVHVGRRHRRPATTIWSHCRQLDLQVSSNSVIEAVLWHRANAKPQFVALLRESDGVHSAKNAVLCTSGGGSNVQLSSTVFSREEPDDDRFVVLPTNVSVPLPSNLLDQVHSSQPPSKACLQSRSLIEPRLACAVGNACYGMEDATPAPEVLRITSSVKDFSSTAQASTTLPVPVDFPLQLENWPFVDGNGSTTGDELDSLLCLCAGTQADVGAGVPDPSSGLMLCTKSTGYSMLTLHSLFDAAVMSAVLGPTRIELSIFQASCSTSLQSAQPVVASVANTLARAAVDFEDFCVSVSTQSGLTPAMDSVWVLKREQRIDTASNGAPPCVCRSPVLRLRSLHEDTTHPDDASDGAAGRDMLRISLQPMHLHGTPRLVKLLQAASLHPHVLQLQAAMDTTDDLDDRMAGPIAATAPNSHRRFDLETDATSLIVHFSPDFDSATVAAASRTQPSPVVTATVDYAASAPDETTVALGSLTLPLLSLHGMRVELPAVSVRESPSLVAALQSVGLAFTRHLVEHGGVAALAWLLPSAMLSECLPSVRSTASIVRAAASQVASAVHSWVLAPVQASAHHFFQGVASSAPSSPPRGRHRATTTSQIGDEGSRLPSEATHETGGHREPLEEWEVL